MNFRYLLISLSLLLAFFAGAKEVKYPPCIAMLGDSNTWNGGDLCDNEKGWNKWFADMLPHVQCRSFARSGATWTHTVKTRPDTLENTAIISDNNVIYNQILRLENYMKQNPDFRPIVVIVSAGTNDLWFSNLRPGLDKQLDVDNKTLTGMSPSEVTNLYDAVRYDLLYLRRLLPEAAIVVLTPLQTTQVDDTIIEWGSDVIMYASIAVDSNMPFIRLCEKTPIRSEEERRQKHYTTDGTHTSPEGAKAVAKAVYNYLLKLAE
ncbi:MAG: SGNH/GDSL hydrolase family protein [Clostridium sp.]|nr:SGNH/GDSL hydrolase family protein [Prevotella sp.]MCM1429021.1 SGNH/GDSL hydrolase family protein [Clostridium sp.]MCM1475448.1 SGNH/GDSL hydrolase family protein [Muribaculaceae bacterium]